MESNRLLHASLPLLFLVTWSYGGHVRNDELHLDGPALKMDQALLTFHNQLPEEVQIFYTSDHCYKCVYQQLVTVKPNNNSSATISTVFTLSLQVESRMSNTTLCRWSQTYEEGGRYSVWIQVPLAFSQPQCNFSVDKNPNNATLREYKTPGEEDEDDDANGEDYLPQSFAAAGGIISFSFLSEQQRTMSPSAARALLTDVTGVIQRFLSFPALLVAALLLAIIALLFVATPYICRRHCTSKFIKTICCQGPQYSLEDDSCESVHDTVKAKSSRLLSLDTFRGFAITVMVFVNYGGGGYWFFQHAPWNGLMVADLVMPWFVFIIGTSVVLAISSMQRRGVTRLQLLRKITWRTAVLMMLGFCFLNYSPRDGPRSVLVLAKDPWSAAASGLHLLCSVSPFHWRNSAHDICLYWPQWLVIIVLEMLWLCITLLMPVPDCPTGYLGAGGIGDGGRYPNCTGGAAGYIDRWMFGDNMYRYPTCKGLYRTVQPFDPEGVLGTINSVVMGFLGMQAGKIIIFYKRKTLHCLCRYLLWAVILGASAAVLSKCTRDEGFIPVNKNLWSLSYVLCMGSFSFLLLGVMYFIIDVKGWWGGQPFLYPGTNSILVYVGHSLLGFYFPFSWEMHFQESHWEPLLQNLWGTALWVLIAYLLYRKRFFLKI
ncbi:heparan-alpha-glucosaminide N-acetyltransferase-like [Nothobranchius furzeri]|uniref:Heparan-alpha-glucosaminide N-acetyltransferase-like n=1 Tax=Nothobranchius furzeri TaxID=105023 RepID=A0A9D2YGG9_NOTFU|nr:heparan-alpha-glucosaminide N-acetyltransferase-like [Nothobranchius furzeri]